MSPSIFIIMTYLICHNITVCKRIRALYDEVFLKQSLFALQCYHTSNIMLVGRPFQSPRFLSLSMALCTLKPIFIKTLQRRRLLGLVQTIDKGLNTNAKANHIHCSLNTGKRSNSNQPPTSKSFLGPGFACISVLWSTSPSALHFEKMHCSCTNNSFKRSLHSKCWSNAYSSVPAPFQQRILNKSRSQLTRSTSSPFYSPDTRAKVVLSSLMENILQV